MADAAPTTVVAAISHAGDRVLTILPPAFLVLCGLNIIFIGFVLWFINAEMEVRTAMVNKMLDSCIALDHGDHAQAQQGRFHAQ